MAIGLGRARLGIPRINQNPRPPHLEAARIARPNFGISRGQGLHTPRTLRVQVGPPAAPHPTAQPSNSVAATPGSTSGASTSTPSLPVVKVPTQPKETFPEPIWSPAKAGENDPRDPTYWENLSKLRYTDQQEYNKIGEEAAKENAGYNAAKQEAIRNRAVQERQLGETAIKANLGASGWLNRTQGEQATVYTSARAKADLTQKEQVEAFNRARKALEEGFSVEAAGLLAEGGERLAKREGEEAAKGAPEAPAAPAAPAAPSGSKGGKGKGGGGGKGHGIGNGGTTAPAPANYNPTRAAIANRVLANRKRNR